jgi:hypothetical protein
MAQSEAIELGRRSLMKCIAAMSSLSDLMSVRNNVPRGETARRCRRRASTFRTDVASQLSCMLHQAFLQLSSAHHRHNNHSSDAPRSNSVGPSVQWVSRNRMVAGMLASLRGDDAGEFCCPSASCSAFSTKERDWLAVQPTATVWLQRRSRKRWRRVRRAFCWMGNGLGDLV